MSSGANCTVIRIRPFEIPNGYEKEKRKDERERGRAKEGSAKVEGEECPTRVLFTSYRCSSGVSTA